MREKSSGRSGNSDGPHRLPRTIGNRHPVNRIESGIIKDSPRDLFNDH